jgi:hypothetical protein
MRRTLIVAILLMVGPAAATAAHAAATKPPKLAATLDTCTASPLPVQRIASFVGSMPARAHATRMRMRFDLERRRPGERRWRAIQAPGFGVWERSKPRVAGFVFTKRVTSLPVPARYRARVRFAWVGADGRTVGHASARTPGCNQPDLRPNLVPGDLTAVLDRQPGLAVYTLLVRNAGRSASGAFSVRVGTAAVEVAPLAAGDERAVDVIGLACLPLTPIVVRVDADHRVDEAEERGNGTRRQCPLPLG